MTYRDYRTVHDLQPCVRGRTGTPVRIGGSEGKDVRGVRIRARWEEVYSCMYPLCLPWKRGNGDLNSDVVGVVEMKVRFGNLR